MNGLNYCRRRSHGSRQAAPAQSNARTPGSGTWLALLWPAAAFDARGRGAIVNNSRGIIFAHGLKPYAERFGAARWQSAVEAATHDMIGQLRSAIPLA